MSDDDAEAEPASRGNRAQAVDKYAGDRAGGPTANARVITENLPQLQQYGGLYQGFTG